MHYFQLSSLNINQPALFGVIILFGLIGGGLIKYTKILPVILGYILIGYLIGPHGFNIINNRLLGDTKILIDVSLGLILFTIGRHLDFAWLRNDFGLVLTTVTESFLTFIFTFTVLYFFHVPVFLAALLAVITITTSPMVVMMVAHDLSAKGPVTRRTLILTSLNNFIGIILFNLFLPFISNGNGIFSHAFFNIFYNIFGSFILGIVLFYFTKCTAFLIGKSRANQFILFIAIIALGVGLADALHLPSMLTLFCLGVCARNFDFKNTLMEVDFDWIAGLFYILIFVLIGAHLKLDAIFKYTPVILSIIAIRLIAKFIGVFVFSKMSRVTLTQSSAIALALIPMAGIALGMSNIITISDPNLGYQVLNILMGLIAFLNLVGPIFTQVAFIMTGETPDSKKRLIHD